MKKVLVVIGGIALLALAVYYLASPKSEEASSTGPYPEGIYSPEEELAGFQLQDGFVIELVASEKDGIIKPIDLTFDDAGRLWTQTARMYPLDPFADLQWEDLLRLMDDQETQQNHPAFKKVLDLFQGRTPGQDQILILTDFYGEGRKPKVSVWADSLAIPMSIMPVRSGAYVAQGSELFFLDDTNGDGRADKRHPLITGFGFTDTHTMAHSLVRGPGDWMYFSHGGLNKGEVTSLSSGAKLVINFSKIVRFSMEDAARMEIVTSGLNNIWGFQLRHNGQWYATEANDLGYTTVPLEPGAGFPGIGLDRIREYQPFMPPLHEFRVGGTGLSGLAFADDVSGSFPDEWKDVAFLANPITSTINAVRVRRNPDGTVTNEHLPDLLTSRDLYFRPVNIEFGPDGCLYIADWYNKIISHNEVPTSHPERDRSHGRIWRIRHKSQKPREIVNFYEVPTNQLVKYLSSPSLWERRAAWNQIADRPEEETKPLISELVALASDASADESARIHALWCLEALRHYDETLIASLIKSVGHDLRREAVRSLVTFDVSPQVATKLLDGMINDGNPMIRSQVIRTLAGLSKADASTIAILVEACKPELPGNEMGGSYERRFERYLALMALEQYPEELDKYIIDTKAANPVNLLWAIRALPRQRMEELFPSLWAASGLTELTEQNFLTVAKMLKDPRIFSLMKPVIEQSGKEVQYLRFAVNNQQFVQSDRLATLLKRPAEEVLRNGNNREKDVALDAVARFGISVPMSLVTSVISETTPDRTVNLALKVLDNNPKANVDMFTRIATNEKMTADLRITAAHSLARSGHSSALDIVKGLIGSFNDDQKKVLAGTFSSSEQGAAMLSTLYGEKQLDSKIFSLAAAERIQQARADDPAAAEILASVKARMEEERKQFEARLAKYMDIANRVEGDPKRGEELFQTCLMCHRVGDKGQSIAPALDGSASRDTESLLTALLEPDAAVERAYSIFRVTRKDNTTVEGYLSNRDDNGTTISFMGGSKVFIPMEDIKSQSFLGGRSFMPRGLIDNYSEQEVADLLAYIGTLK